jgi:putative thiamine transport system ATP-binding protein
MNALRLDGVTLDIDGKALFAPLSFTVKPGNVTSVVGPSGSGKSSLLAYLCGILPAEIEGHGAVYAGDNELTHLATERRALGLLFQDSLLFPHLSVGGNLMFGLAARQSRAARLQRVNEALASVALDGFADRDPATLSGGQKSRVALLRVLLAEPRALLLDEPFSALDDDSRVHVRSLVFAEAQRLGLPTLLVTHDMEDVAAAGGDVIELRHPQDRHRL